MDKLKVGDRDGEWTVQLQCLAGQLWHCRCDVGGLRLPIIFWQTDVVA